MKIFVTGATGVVGRRAVPLMIAAGHKVTAAGRSRDKLAALERIGASVIAVNLFDAQAVEHAINGHAFHSGIVRTIIS
jgi:2-alkyl-3-oxoalkanoate reductase